LVDEREIVRANGTFDYVDGNALRLSRGRRDGLVPALLDGLEAYCLVETSEADETVDDGGEGGDFAELHTEDGGDEVEPGHCYETPIQGTDYD
jgi:hypothetical protein